LGFACIRIYTWEYGGLGTSRFTATSSNGFQVNRIRLSQLGTSLLLAIAEAGLEGQPDTRMIDRLNTRWLRLSPKVASGALLRASTRAAERIFCGHTHEALHEERDAYITTIPAGGRFATHLFDDCDEQGVQIHDYKQPNLVSELTIVIPAKNEAKLIPRLLTSLNDSGLLEDVEYESFGR